MLLLGYQFTFIMDRTPLRLTPALVLLGVGVVLFVAIVARLIMERRR